MARGRHAEALETVDGRCPRCGAPRSKRQEYCVECGLRLPPATGAIPALRRRWLRRLGWYPGDWIWVSLLTLLVAVAGAAVAIAFGSSSGPASGQTLVAKPPPTAPATTTTTGTLPSLPTTSRTKKRTKTKPATSVAPPGHTPWPAGRDGWTNVLFSYPLTGGTAAPSATAVRAAKDGLPDVGVLDSSDYASLHPGYYVVFSGVYSTSSEAQAALKTVQATGFASAYTRQITR